MAFPGAFETTPTGINNAGDIVGSYTPQQNQPIGYGFLLHAGNFTNITAPPGFNTYASGIDSAGDIVGSTSGIHGGGFLLKQGTFTTVGPPGGGNVHLYGIDDSGDMVGIYGNSLGSFNGFIFTNNGAVPAAPWNLAAGQDKTNPNTQINLYWQDNSSNEAGFKIFRSLDRGLTFTQVATVGPDITSWVDTGLTPLTAYYYNVTAWNPAGSSAASNTDWTVTAEGTSSSGTPPAPPSRSPPGMTRQLPVLKSMSIGRPTLPTRSVTRSFGRRMG